MKKNTFFLGGALIIIAACNRSQHSFDASGTFEADEVIVSASANGRLLSFNVEEGSMLAKDSSVGLIDPVDLTLQKEQVQESIHSLSQQTINVEPQIKLLQEQLTVQQSQLDNMLHEKSRIENLLRQDAATGKQLDDINAQIDVVKKQMNVTQQQISVQKSNIGTQNSSILSQGKPLEKRVAQLEEQIRKANILNPINGTVLTKYAEAGEMTSTGKALYKIADLSVITLRAYISGTQLSQLKLNQVVRVWSMMEKINTRNFRERLPGSPIKLNSHQRPFKQKMNGPTLCMQ